MSRDFYVQVQNAVYEEVIKKLKINKLNIAQKIGLAIRRSINASPAITSMMAGNLKAEFGFIDGTAVVKRLLDAIETSIDVEVGNVRPLLVEITLDKDKILATGVGEFQSKNGEVPWLDWLLTSNGKTVIIGYHIEYKKFPKTGRRLSRSGEAVMIPGGTYAVQKFSGNRERNFITDAINEITLNEITAAITEVL